MLYPQRKPLDLGPPGDGVTADEPDDAAAWFTAEHHVLLTMVPHAYELGFDLHAWRLARSLTTYLDLHGHWHDWAATQRTALAAATRAGDRPAQAFSQLNIGMATAQLGLADDAETHLGHALKLYRDLGEPLGEASVRNTLARGHGSRGDHRAALRESQRAAALFSRAGHDSSHARALNNIGWYHGLLGENEQALRSCEEALALHQRIDDRYGEANTRDSLALVSHRLGQHHAAVGHYEAAIDLWQALGDRHDEAQTLVRLGDTHAETGAETRARQAYTEALNLLTALGHADAATVTAKLDALPAHR